MTVVEPSDVEQPRAVLGEASFDGLVVAGVEMRSAVESVQRARQIPRAPPDRRAPTGRPRPEENKSSNRFGREQPTVALGQERVDVAAGTRCAHNAEASRNWRSGRAEPCIP